MLTCLEAPYFHHVECVFRIKVSVYEGEGLFLSNIGIFFKNILLFYVSGITFHNTSVPKCMHTLSLIRFSRSNLHVCTTLPGRKRYYILWIVCSITFQTSIFKNYDLKCSFKPFLSSFLGTSLNFTSSINSRDFMEMAYILCSIMT
jgi:hypothetical protein